MNTADRSIAMIDFAIRRRFRFISCTPSEEGLSNFYGTEKARAAFAIELMKAVNLNIPDTDLHVGHSYFMTKEVVVDDWKKSLAHKIAHEVRPLLIEYRAEGSITSLSLNLHDKRQLDLSLPAEVVIEQVINNFVEGT
jgi:5-methylcytosine-specific restriction protein B